MATLKVKSLLKTSHLLRKSKLDPLSDQILQEVCRYVGQNKTPELGETLDDVLEFSKIVLHAVKTKQLRAGHLEIITDTIQKVLRTVSKGLLEKISRAIVKHDEVVRLLPKEQGMRADYVKLMTPYLSTSHLSNVQELLEGDNKKSAKSQVIRLLRKANSGRTKREAAHHWDLNFGEVAEGTVMQLNASEGIQSLSSTEYLKKFIEFTAKALDDIQ